jgi:macrolide transport system ATP-binding/permease protein
VQQIGLTDPESTPQVFGMTATSLEFSNVTFHYPSASSPVFEDLALQFGTGWTGVIGPNGAGKTTLLRLACRQLTPTRGNVRCPDHVIYCPQRTDDPPSAFDAFLEATDRTACVLRGRLDVGDDWASRWLTLSHGERKRAQIGVALWRRPRVLAVDEPTNHIDMQARRLLAEAMRSFRGVGLLVSHDRELLDSLCRQCAFVEPPGATIRPGGYTKATEQIEAEQEHARHARQQARQDLKRLEREASNRQREAQRSHRMRSKRGLPTKDHDARSRVNQARLTGKDGQAGRLLRQMDGRVEQAQAELEGIRAKKQQKMGITLRGNRSRRDVLFRLPAGQFQFGDGRALVHPDVCLSPRDRVALTGPNGSGKTTLVTRILSQLDLPEEQVVYLAQEIDRSRGALIMAQLRALSKTTLGEVMSVISRLGSDPERVMETDEPSPGEVRKILLALGLARAPHLIVMDEPTNHLDLPSIECLEDALAACDAALLLVSHDIRFLQKLTTTRWELSADTDHATGRRVIMRVGEMRAVSGTAS